MARKQPDNTEYSTRERRTIKWTFLKILVTIVLFISTLGIIYLSVEPLIEGEFELKSFVSVFFALLGFFFLFAVTGIRKNSHFFFWALGLSTIDMMNFTFLMYDSLF